MLTVNKENYTMSYTPEMVAKITAAAPLNLEKAHILAGELSVSYRSIIAKAKSEGIVYEKKVAAAKKPKGLDGPTKAEMLGAIRLALALPSRQGDLTKSELSSVLESIG
jgi:ABC-type Fe3+ transport system substrate-binding protein